MGTVEYDIAVGAESKQRARAAAFDALDLLVSLPEPSLPASGFGRVDYELANHLGRVKLRVDELRILAEAVVSVMDGVHEAVVAADRWVGKGGPR